MQSWIWLVLMLVLLVIEAMTVGLTTIWFAAGALVAYGTSWLGLSPVLQVVVFLVVSIVLFVLTRPLLVNRLNKSRTKTNVDGLIGKEARVTERIDSFEGTGTAVLEGKTWTARSSKGQVIEAQRRARVLAVEGVKLILEEIPESPADADREPQR
ncbi:MAG: NfeD family protein [Lachnospiraceae bacterium]|nr:NfeD family protein [Lachnospiraceae bacterium]MBR0154300.1 NfeD family protein [Lachnospiraceae bacterium]